jgi:hypothetical protein
MNFNTLAKNIANREGMKESVNIAQIREILSITLDELGQLKASEALALIEKHSQ